MKSYHEETLAALFDGEATEPEALADALAQPDAVAFLVELSRLRALTQDDDRRPDDRFYAEMKGAFQPRGWHRLFLRRVPLPAAAAAAVAAAVVAGALAGSLLGPESPPATPPAPRLAAAPQPGTRPPESPPATAPAPPSRRPPVPQRVMQFVEGRDWRRQGL